VNVNDPMSLIVLFFAVSVMWFAAILAIMALVKGGTGGTHPTPHRDGETRSPRGRGVLLRLHKDP
jgi:hypothetical protein